MITFLVGQPPLLFLCIFAVGAVLVFGVLPWVSAFLESRKLKTSQPVRILARADEQHAAIMRGDLIAGTFGMYPPADWWLDEWRDLHMPTVKAPRPIRDSSPTGLALARMDGIVDMMEAMSP